MAETMQAWRFHGTNKEMTLEDVERPTAGPGEVLVEVKAAGLCHSDVSALDDENWMHFFWNIPHTLGHENAGVVVEAGEGMEEWMGKRVGLSPVMPDGDAIGYGNWEGGYGPYVRATEANLVPLPDGVSFENAAVATDAGLTSYHAMVAVGGCTMGSEGMKVGVIGLGGLGFMGARVAVLHGAEVYAAEISDKREAIAEKIGLAGVSTSILDFKDKELDLIVDYAGFGTTTAEAIEAVKEGGTVVQVGLGRSEATISTQTMVLKQVRFLGSKSGTKEDLAAIYELMDGDKCNPPKEIIAPAEIPAGLDRLRQGGVDKRLVAVYGD